MDLLREYATSNSEQAFRALVDRHLNMVYATALRQVHDVHAAEEVTQAVFVALARKASSISKATILAGWLFRAARFAGTKAKRGEDRRKRWESEAAKMEPVNSESGWEQIAPFLNDAIAELGETDRAAIILRFFESKTMQQVGSALGTSEGAAKMRLSRAMERLRRIFQKRGVVISSAVLLAVLSTPSAPAAPAGLASSIMTSTLLKQATTSTLTKGIITLMTWTKRKTAAAAGLALLLAGGTTALVLARLPQAQSAAKPSPGIQPATEERIITTSVQDQRTEDLEEKKRAEELDHAQTARDTVKYRRTSKSITVALDGYESPASYVIRDANGITNGEVTVPSAEDRTLIVRKKKPRLSSTVSSGGAGSIGAAGGGVATTPSPTPAPESQ